MKKHFLLFLLSFVLFSNKSSAQAVLGISQYSYTVSHDTVSDGTTDSISIWVVNTSAVDFNDTLHIRSSVQDTAASTFHQVSDLNIGYHFIPAHDSIQKILLPTYTVSTLQYHYDINVIVIWPVAASASISDSLHYQEVITISDGVHEIDLTSLIKAYPNPASDNFTIENTGKISIEEVRIYDPSGQLVNVLKNQSIIGTETWKPGVYMVEILLKNKQRQTIRIIKQK